MRIALLSHKPLAAAEAELAAAPAYRFWPPAARDRLAGLCGAGPPALIVSGHVHQSRQLRLDGVEHVWVPTTWAVLPDQVQPVLGSKRAGVMSLTFEPALPPRPEFAEPHGIRQLTLTEDVPDPYHSH